jgi:hypothetical protein
MQTAPATSRKTPKVVSDDFLSASKTAVESRERRHEDRKRGDQLEPQIDLYLPGAAVTVASSRHVTRTTHRKAIKPIASDVGWRACSRESSAIRAQ